MACSPGVKTLITMPLGIGSALAGAVYAPTVVAGVHHMYNALEAGMLSADGLDIWMPIATAANVAQGAAALALAVKTKDQKLKGMRFRLHSPHSLVSQNGDLWCQPSLYQMLCSRLHRRRGRRTGSRHHRCRFYRLWNHGSVRLSDHDRLCMAVYTGHRSCVCDSVCVILAVFPR